MILEEENQTRGRLKVLMPCIKACICVIGYFSAPSQPPGNIEWNLTNSKIFLNWEHVKAMDNESEVIGYKVRVFCNG